MNEKELAVKHYEMNVRLQETRVRDAKSALDRGYAKLQADFERDYERLKTDYARECIELERQQVCLVNARELAEIGFET